MARTDLVVVDETVTARKDGLEKRCKSLDKHITTYIEILDDILSDSITEGETADALKEFQSYALTLKDVLPGIGEEAAGMCANFLAEIDEADQFLY